ncbi:cytochrome b [Paracoccus sp. R86501]|uniref:cytochrome b n=1 Tax=Paracoccus sp. R86501 TaxID=3101711 RepID=UPI00366B217D
MADRQPRYGATARFLHWLVALGVLLMIPAGLIMVRDGLPRALQDVLFLFHKNIGVLLLLIVVVRIIWRMTHPAPPLPPQIPMWQRRIAALSHLALYALLVVMPVTGYLRVRAGGYPIEALDALGIPTLVARNKSFAEAASEMHEIAAFLLIALLALHIGAALHHALIQHDGVWSRMWPIGRRD